MTMTTASNSLPIPAISLPLILGLSTRTPDAPKHIVASLLREYNGYCTIQRALKAWLHRRRGGDHRGNHHNIADIIPSSCQTKYDRCYVPFSQRRHWMWRAFLSANLRVRRIVFRILMDGMHQLQLEQEDENNDNSNTYASKNHSAKIIGIGKVCSYYQRMCIGIVLELIDENMLQCVVRQNDASSMFTEEEPFVKLNELEGGEPIVQYIGVLLHLVMIRRLKEESSPEPTSKSGEAVHNIIKKEEETKTKSTCNNDKESKHKPIKSLISDIKNDLSSSTSLPMPTYEKLSLGIEDFVAASGLRWAVRWMLQLSTLLCLKESKVSSSFSSIDSAIYIRLHLISDFSYRLLHKHEHLNRIAIWEASVPLTSHGDSSLTTLASFILMAHVFVRQLKGHTDNVVSSGLLKSILIRIITPIEDQKKKRDRANILKSHANRRDDAASMLNNGHINSMSAAELIDSANRGLHLPSGSFMLSSGAGGIEGEIDDIIMADEDDEDCMDLEEDDDDEKDEEVDVLDEEEGMEEELDEELMVDEEDDDEGEETELEHSQSDSEIEVDQEIHEQHDDDEEETKLPTIQEDDVDEHHHAFELLQERLHASREILPHESLLLSSSSQQNSISTKKSELVIESPIRLSLEKRKRIYLSACVQVLESQLRPVSTVNFLGSHILCQEGIMSLIKSMCDVVRPPPRPLSLKVFMRRAPTQEEFFRGSLSKNPILLSTVKPLSGVEPAMSDLRQHIAKDLQMADSAELLELLVGGKIIDLSLKVRVVQQVHWVKHVLDSSDLGYSSDTSASSFPPMVVTYRLAGVDGEATEDKVDTLTDPEGTGQVDVEKEFAITEAIAEAGTQRCFFLLLRAIDIEIGNILRKIRRDEVTRMNTSTSNHSKELFIRSPPCSALILLQHCANLKTNRRRMVKARAPAKMLKILLDVLSIIDTNSLSKGNGKSTAECLQALIATLASDISTIADIIDDDNEDNQDSETVELLLQSLTESKLAAPLRKIIADLLPFLTYGQRTPSQALASKFVQHVNFCELSDDESKSILMETFIQTAISLPAVSVCNELRGQLVTNGFTQSVAKFAIDQVPDNPPPWVPALFSKEKFKIIEDSKKEDLEIKWRKYLSRNGLQKSFKMLIGLSNQHPTTQKAVVDISSLILTCHWIESTSDMGDLGLLAETLLDVLKEQNDYSTNKIDILRQVTKSRKKELADSRRNRALMGINISSQNTPSPIHTTNVSKSSTITKVHDISKDPVPIPAWMAEMEAMEDEDGLTCAVCQEGCVFQPNEMLGLYVYMKKVLIPSSKGGSKNDIEGASLFSTLPLNLPTNLQDSLIEELLFRPLKPALSDIRSQSALHAGLSSSSRQPFFVTTVTAGNAIHYSCHSKAKQADRSHPKAPKGEWEGAALRNSRVSCNAVMPLVSSLKRTEVPLVVIDATLANYQSAVVSVGGSRPKTMLWTVLHDIRLLLLRIAYDESLSSDCGGGSLTSNAGLVFQLFLMADMFTKNAEIESPSLAKHIKFLAAGFIFGIEVVDGNRRGKNVSYVSLHKAAIDASLMASICCILFNKKSVENESSTNEFSFASGLWKKFRSTFISGLLRLGGRRKRQGIEHSGCIMSRAQNRKIGKREEWVTQDKNKSVLGKRSKHDLEDTDSYLRPMIMLFVMLENLSNLYDSNDLDDTKIFSSAESFVNTIEKCRKSKDIHELCSMADLKMDEEKIYAEFDVGYSV